MNKNKNFYKKENEGILVDEIKEKGKSEQNKIKKILSEIKKEEDKWKVMRIVLIVVGSVVLVVIVTGCGLIIRFRKEIGEKIRKIRGKKQ